VLGSPLYRRNADQPIAEDDEMYLMKNATTSAMILVELRSSAGAPVSELAYGDVTACYIQENDSVATAISLSLGVLGTWSSGGWIEVDPALAPGIYQFGIPNAALSASANERSVVLRFSASGVSPKTVPIQLVAINPYDTVRAGLTALPNAVAGAANGVPVLDGAGDLIVDAGDVTLTAAYDAAKTAASATLVGTVKTVVDAGATATALGAVSTKVDNVQTAVNLRALATALTAVADQITAAKAVIDAGATGTALTAVADQITAAKAVIDLGAIASVVTGQIAAVKGVVDAGATATGLSAVSTKVDNVKSVADLIRATDVVGIAAA
jgi:hypothetical protein